MSARLEYEVRRWVDLRLVRASRVGLAGLAAPMAALGLATRLAARRRAPRQEKSA